MLHHFFGTNSTKHWKELEKDLQLIMTESLKDTPFDFGIHEGHRTIAEQKESYAQGRTKPGNIITNIDGVKNRSKHNIYPAEAVDIHMTISGRRDLTWDTDHIFVIAGVIIATANRLYREGKVRHRVRWGGNFNNNEIITTKDPKESFFDPIHFEIYLP